MSHQIIGTLAEKSLHAALKTWLCQPDDQTEVPLDGYFIDIVRGERLIEIQTAHLYALKPKLRKLLDEHPVTLVHPIARERWIARQTADGQSISRRKSPKRGRVIDAFSELVRMGKLLLHPNLSLSIVLIQEEEIWRDDGRGSWRRRGWSVYDRRLLSVVEEHTLDTAADYLALLPAGLPQPFTNRELAAALPCRPYLAQKMTYTMRQTGLLKVVGKQSKSLLLVANFPVEMD
jgi:hypothetical protein